MKKIFKISALSLGFSIAGAASAADLCNVTYEAVNSWGSGAQQAVTVVNNGPALNAWQLSWTFNGSENIDNLWDGVLSQTGANVTVNNAGYNGSVGTGGQFSFGFTVSSWSDNFPTEFYLNGEACSGAVDPNPNPNPEPTDGAVWELNSADSVFSFVTVKKEHVAEVQTFTAYNATVDSDGVATLAIDLNSAETNIDIRNERFRNVLFETAFLPTLYYSVQLDMASLSALAVGDAQTQTLGGTLTLHGVQAVVEAEVLVVKTSATDLTVSTSKPILIKAADFDLVSGVESLRALASLSSIGQTVPVYFRLDFDAADPQVTNAVAVPATPAAPTSLTADFTESSGIAALNWNDASNNETEFLVRRREASTGYWSRLTEVNANSTLLEDLLLDEDTYDYKVIALNNGVPSAPSPVATVVATTNPNPEPLTGEEHYQAKCASCHGDDASGGVVGVALNTERDLTVMLNTIVTRMPPGEADNCDQECAEAIGGYIQTTFWNGGEPEPELACDTVTYGARQLKLLTKAEYQRSVEDLVGIDYNVASGLAEDNIIGYFVNNTTKVVVPTVYDQYLTVAEEIAQWSADRNFAGALTCGTNFNQTCANQFVNDFAPKVFRRALSSDEAAAYLAIANGSATNGDVKAGIQLAMEGLFSSPQFVYRHELGEANPNNNAIDSDAFELTSYEMATWLSYTYAGTTPDAIAMQKAANNQLRTDAEIRAEAQRLLEGAGAKQKMGDFVASWLGTDHIANAPKDASVWPGFDALIPHLQTEIREMFSYVMLEPTESFASVYNANYTFVNGPLAQHYGINGVSGNEFQKVATTDRGGILANGAFMARWGESVESSPIRRSVRVRRRMLCQDQPDPPGNVNIGRENAADEFHEALADPTTTNRERYQLLTSGETCATCHQEWINPLGFGMEDFTAVGTRRVTDLNGNTIDASGQLYAPENLNDKDVFINFNGTQGLGALLTTLPSAQSCLPQNLFRYSVGVGVEGLDDNPEGNELVPAERDGYACEVKNLTSTMLEQSPRAMLEGMGSMQAVRYRKAWAR